MEFIRLFRFFGLLAAVIVAVGRLVIWATVRPVLARDLKNPSANPIVNEQLAQLTQCQETGLALREHYLPRVSGTVGEFDLAADAALRAIDELILTLDRTRRELVKSQHPLPAQRLQRLLAQGRQLQEVARSLR